MSAHRSLIPEAEPERGPWRPYGFGDRVARALELIESGDNGREVGFLCMEIAKAVKANMDLMPSDARLAQYVRGLIE
jgi:hypothetical protein